MYLFTYFKEVTQYFYFILFLFFWAGIHFRNPRNLVRFCYKSSQLMSVFDCNRLKLRRFEVIPPSSNSFTNSSSGTSIKPRPCNNISFRVHAEVLSLFYSQNTHETNRSQETGISGRKLLSVSLWTLYRGSVLKLQVQHV